MKTGSGKKFAPKKPVRGLKKRVSIKARVAEKPQTLCEVFKPFIGMADDLPSDMAENHDHYLYGTPKRK